MAPTSTGTLDPDVIRRTIQRGIGDVRRCYEAGLLEQPDLKGRVTVRFVISAKGSVASAITVQEESTLHARLVEGCIEEKVRRWTFPRPTGGDVVVTYPFTLTATE